MYLMTQMKNPNWLTVNYDSRWQARSIVQIVNLRTECPTIETNVDCLKLNPLGATCSSENLSSKVRNSKSLGRDRPMYWPNSNFVKLIKSHVTRFSGSLRMKLRPEVRNPIPLIVWIGPANRSIIDFRSFWHSFWNSHGSIRSSGSPRRPFYGGGEYHNDNNNNIDNNGDNTYNIIHQLRRFKQVQICNS